MVVPSQGFEAGRFFRIYFALMAVMAIHFAIIFLVITQLEYLGLPETLEYVAFFAPVISMMVCMGVVGFRVSRGKQHSHAKTISQAAESPKPVKIKKPPSKSYKPLAWIAFGIYAVVMFYFTGYMVLDYANVATPDILASIGGGLVAVGLVVVPIFGIIALVKRSKYKPKDLPKAKFNIWALLALLVPVIGFVFAIISITKKEYSCLSRYFSCWIAVGWLSAILLVATSLIMA